MKTLDTDVLVIGAGAAGLVCALSLQGKKVSVIAKAPMGQGASSAWAQGGIAAPVGDDDTVQSHVLDTLSVGGNICDHNAVSSVIKDAKTLVDHLIGWGVEFDRTETGALALGREAAHSVRRILHANGDSSGKEIMRALGQEVQKATHIELMEDCQAYDLISDGRSVYGALVENNQGEEFAVYAKDVVLATGGIGSLFGFTTNPQEARGDGLAMAARAGARLSDLEFVQFHPTAIQVGLTPMPLATEALRGEGALLVDQHGVRFMPSVHPDAELAPRDVVARAIWHRVKSGKKVFLDATKTVGQAFPNKFPTVWQYCQDAGIDPRIEPIPVTPAAHYHMGGVDVDLYGATNIKNLWAVGEVACTGLHGANRLASNSLLEAVVCGRKVANKILENATDEPTNRTYLVVSKTADKGSLDDIHELSSLMYRACGVERNEGNLLEALARVEEWSHSEKSYSVNFKNSLLVCKMILVCALERRESRGGHFRTDYPESNKKFEKRTFTSLKEVEAFIRGLNLRSDRQEVLSVCQKPA